MEKQPMKQHTRLQSMINLGALLAVMLFAVTTHADKTPPAFGIPRMSKPPVLDGTIDPVEWQEAVAVSGVGPPLIARPTTYYLAWDDGHLYLAARAWVRPDYKPRVSGRSPGAANTFDDGLELHFQPRGHNVPTGRTDSSYKFNINCLGFSGDFARMSVGQQFRNWTPNFKTATRLTPPGSAPLGGRWWEIEIVATPEDFELVGPHRAGDVWKLMLGFNHLYIGWSQARIPAYSDYFDPSGYPVGTLVENAPAIQMTMDELPGFVGGQAALQVAAYNPAAQPVTLTMNVRVADDTGAELISKSENLTVAARDRQVFALNEKLAKELPDKPGRIEVVVKQGDREVFTYANTFVTQYPPEALQPYEKPKEAFPLAATFNPIRSTLRLSGDAYYLDDPDAAGALRYRVTHAGEGREVVAGTLTNAFTHFFRDLIQLPPLAEGEYAVTATLVGRDGKDIGTETATFKKQDEAKAFPEWWNTKVGDPERVIWPFTAMTRTKNDVAMWGRRYTLDALGLPAQIESRNGPVLAAPARLVATVNGREEVIPLGGALRVTETKDWRVSFTGQAKGAGLVFTTKGTVEQDGLVWLELTYAPAGKQPVKLDALRVEFPLANDVAESLYCQGPGANYSAKTAILLPPEQTGKLWDTLDTGRSGSGMAIGSFYPSVWLGNEQRGLLWWGDNDKGWVVADETPAHAVHRQGAAVVLRNNIVGVPVALDAARTIEFGYMASPFRPLPKGWRATINSENGTFRGPAKVRKDSQTGEEYVGWQLITPPSPRPEEWSAIWAEHKVHADKRVRELQPFDPLQAHRKDYVHTSLPLMGYGWKSPDKRVTDYFGPDWEGDSWNQTEQDYILYLADRAFREGGLRAIYWDIFYVTPFKTVQNGLAYELPDGRVQPGYNGVNLRRFMMRLVALMNDHGLLPGGLMAHATNAYPPIAMPWMEAILDGEFHELNDSSTMDWVDGYPIDRMRAMSVAHNWGVSVSWMSLIKLSKGPKKDLVDRGFRDWPRMFDTWASWFSNLPEPVLDFGMNDERVVYHPFWRNPFVTTNDKDVLVSLWQLPDRVILMAFNHHRTETKNAEIVMDLDKLNLVPKLPWQEFIGVRDLVKDDKEPKTSLDFYNRTLKVPALAPHTGRVIGVRRY
jgi:hypothetical protein